MTDRPPYLMGEGVSVFVCGGGRGGREKGEFEQTEQAGGGPTCFVLVTM